MAGQIGDDDIGWASQGGGGSGGGTIGGTVVGGTANSVLFVDPSGNLGQDNANFDYVSGSGLTVKIRDSGTNTVVDPITISHDTSATATTNFGVGILFQGQDSTTADQSMAQIQSVWTTATHASRASSFQFLTVTAAGALTNYAEINSTGLWIHAPGNSGPILSANGGSGQQRTILSYSGGTEVLSIFSNGTNHAVLTASGSFLLGSSLGQTAGAVNFLTINTNGTTDALANVQFNASAATSKALVVQAFASQTANILEVQSSTGALLSGHDASGNIFASSGTSIYEYNTTDQTTNYERLRIGTSIVSNVFGIRPETGGTGTLRPIAFYAGNSTNSYIVIGNSVTAPLIVSNFSATTAGTNRFIIGNGFTNTATSGTASDLLLTDLFSPTATSTMIARGVDIAPTINYSNATPGAGSYEALRIRVTETALPTGQNYLIRASAGSAGTTDLFSVYNSGQVNIAANNGIALTNQTSDAGAQAGTITNGPTAGNPAYWLRVQINGSNYAIPAWTAV